MSANLYRVIVTAPEAVTVVGVFLTDDELAVAQRIVTAVRHAAILPGQPVMRVEEASE